MEYNVTAGVLMVFMVAVTTTVLLCCCKAYVICKRRRQQVESNLNERGRNSRRHHHLPVGRNLKDDPPCYDDILSGKIPSSLAVSNDFEISISDVKACNDDGIMVKWSYDKEDTESIAPPLYSVVVVVEENDEVPPPSYYQEKDSINNSKIAAGSTANEDSEIKETISLRVHKAFSAVSAFLNGARKNDTNEDPAENVSCDSNVIQTPTSSRGGSGFSSSVKSFQKS